MNSTLWLISLKTTCELTLTSKKACDNLLDIEMRYAVSYFYYHKITRGNYDDINDIRDNGANS